MRGYERVRRSSDRPRGGDLGDYHADLWATAEWVDYDTQYSADVTCLEQCTDDEQVFVTR
jgi:hypothetical protein